MKILAETNLYFKEGSSDKVYNVQVVKNDDGTFNANFQYGRRNSTLNVGAKASHVNQHDAEDAYTKIIREKIGKGYKMVSTPVGQSTPITVTIIEKTHSGVGLQLLNEIDESIADQYINDSSWGMQEKYDGRRLAVRVVDGKITAINKKGIVIDTDQSVADLMLSIGQDVMVDGEIVGSKYYIFDLLEYAGNNLRNLSTAKRYKLLVDIDELKANVVPFYLTVTEKRKAFDELRKNRKEGVVFKLLSHNYVEGRPASGGYQLKCKFWDSATVEVSSVHKTKRSVSVMVYDELYGQVEIGNVTIPPNHTIPKVNDIVEVRYLYYNKGGCLYQPIYLGKRDDQDMTDCALKKLKIKNVDGEDDA